MTVRSGSLIALTALLLCSLAAPAFATPHSGHGHGKKSDKRVLLLDRHDNGLHLGWMTWSARYDMRQLLRHERERRHAALMAWLKSHRGKKPSTGGTVPGGGSTLPPVVTPPSGGTQVPMPEPGAALLFALGTGMVALYMRRPQAA
jgi:hypothetical protein